MNILMTALGLLEFAPAIGKWFSTPSTDSVSKKIIDIAKNVTQQEDLASIVSTLRSDPKQALLFEEKVTAMETEIELSLLHDSQEARKREFNLIQNGRVSYRADVMVFSAVLGLGICLASLGLYGNKLPGEAVGIISTVAGIFGACLKDAYAFEFGSSRGSRQKDQTMAAMMDQL
jgi:hypothetical protein